MSEKTEKTNKIANDILQFSKNILIVNLRFMDKALNMLKPVALEGFNNVTVDGESIGYDSVFVLESYQLEKNLPTRQYLHMVLHCVFQHFFVSTLVNQDAWNLACDISVENTINELKLNCVDDRRAISQQKVITFIKSKVKYMTAESIYRYICDAKISSEDIWEMRKNFFLDDHTIWYKREVRISLSVVSEKGVLFNSFSDGGDSYDDNGEGRGTSETSDGLESTSSDKGGNIVRTGLDIIGEWKKASGQMQMDLETFSKLRGNVAGSFIQNLNAVNREKYDYSSFLKKFAVIGETMKINDDEFDYIFYTYGLKMYEKMPLIEPLEYKEVKRIKEFVIAIDTSGSTSGELVQMFIQKTYNILKQQENFFTKINLHIVQCDAEIQEIVKITNQNEFDEYLKCMEIHGLGGTDFRPVFSYIDKLVENHEFINLKGMIYFTDGFGVFPQKQPDYQVAFVYVDEGYVKPEVPVWAMKLILKPEEIEEVTCEY